MKSFYFLELPRAALSVGGKDRAIFLHRLLTNDIKGLRTGQGKPACLLDRQGKIIFCCAAHPLPEEILLELDPAGLSGAQAALERYVVSDAVAFSNATARFRVFSAYGPAAESLQIAPPHGFVARSPWPELPGMDLWVPAGEAEAASGNFIEACRGAGLKEGTGKDFEVMRIEAGLPRAGREITPEVILNELGREEFVSFTKGCYVGQEIVARIKHRAHPPRLLAGFVMEAATAPAPGDPVLLNNEPVGTVTSSCVSPELGKPIALGFLKYGVEGDGFLIQNLPARKVKLPFV